MEKRIQDELNTIKDIIINTVPVEKIILFGSFANGIPNADSDIDIYVVMSEAASIREIDAIRLIRRAIREKKTIPVDIVVSKESKFNQRRTTPSFERGVVKEGFVLYG